MAFLTQPNAPLAQPMTRAVHIGSERTAKLQFTAPTRSLCCPGPFGGRWGYRRQSDLVAVHVITRTSRTAQTGDAVG